jgi:hypothetical protein
LSGGLFIGLLHTKEARFEKDIEIRLIHSTVQQDLTYWPRERRINVTTYPWERNAYRILVGNPEAKRPF